MIIIRFFISISLPEIDGFFSARRPSLPCRLDHRLGHRIIAPGSNTCPASRGAGRYPDPAAVSPPRNRHFQGMGLFPKPRATLRRSNFMAVATKIGKTPALDPGRQRARLGGMKDLGGKEGVAQDDPEGEVKRDLPVRSKDRRRRNDHQANTGAAAAQPAALAGVPARARHLRRAAGAGGNARSRGGAMGAAFSRSRHRRGIDPREDKHRHHQGAGQQDQAGRGCGPFHLYKILSR